MRGLPRGWVFAKVGDLVDLNPKNDFPDDTAAGFVPMSLMAMGFLEPVKFEKRRWGDIKKSYTHFADGDVLLAKITPCFENGKAGIPVGLPNGIGAGSSEYFVLRPGDSVRGKYLLAYLKTLDFLKEGEINMTGSVGHKRVPKDFLMGREIPLAPFLEQKRIVRKLDAVLARVDATRVRLARVPALLKQFRQAVLAAATSGALTEEWREEQGLGEAWEKVSLADVAHDFSYGTSAKSKKAGLVPVLRMGNIQRGQLDWDDLVFSSDVDEIEKYRLVSGDVLFNRTNSPELVGKTAVFKGEREAIYAGYLIRVRCSDRLLPDFISYCLGSPQGRDYCWRVKSDGVSQSNINAKKLAAFEFDLPSVDEQREIVRRVESLFALADTVKARYEHACGRLEKLTSSLLAKAFRGELVPQDPNDEPAEKLLERVSAQTKMAPRARIRALAMAT